MIQPIIRGDFKEVLPPTYEYLRLSFSPHSGVPLQERWANNKISATFLGDYLATFLPGCTDNNKATERRKRRIKENTTYVANELLENAVKNNGNTTDCFIDLGVHLYTDSIVLTVTNNGSFDAVEGLQAFIDEFIYLGPQEMLDIIWQKKIIELENDCDSDESRLGLLTMAKDYEVKLGWKFEPIQPNSEMIKVTTMAQLPI